MGWLALIAAILSEVSGTLALRVASGGRTAWYVGVAAGYITAFVLLAVALAHGIGLGVAYGVWAASGVALTAIASRVLFKESLTTVMSFGVVLVVFGVLLLETGSAS
jgi:small multidrug resistance pump